MGKKKKLFLFILPLMLVSLASCYVDQTPSDDTTIPDDGTDETPDDTTPDNPDGGTEENPDDPDENPDENPDNPDETPDDPDNPDGDITEPEEELLEIHSYEELIGYFNENYSDINNQNYSIDGGLIIYTYETSDLEGSPLYSEPTITSSIECTNDFIWHSSKPLNGWCDPDSDWCNAGTVTNIYTEENGMICRELIYDDNTIGCPYGSNSHFCGFYSYYGPELYDIQDLYGWYDATDVAFSLYAFTDNANGKYTLSSFKDNVETDSENESRWIIQDNDYNLFNMMLTVAGGSNIGFDTTYVDLDYYNPTFSIKVNDDGKLEFNAYASLSNEIYEFYLIVSNEATKTSEDLENYLNEFTWTSSTTSAAYTNTGSGVTKTYYTRDNEDSTRNYDSESSSAFKSIYNLTPGTQLGFKFERDGYTFDPENTYLNNFDYDAIKYDEDADIYYVDVTRHQILIYAAWIEE